MKRFLLLLQTLLLPLLMSAQISMTVIGTAELDPNDNDARSYYALKDANDQDCAILKVSLNNPVNGVLVLNTKGGLRTVKTQKQQDGEWWFWVSPVVTNIMFSCEGYTPTSYIGVTLKGKSVYRLKLSVDASIATVSTFTLGESVMKLNVTPPDATVFYGKTEACDMGSVTLTDGLFEAILDQGTYYYKIESRFYESTSGKYVLTDKSPEKAVSLKPAFGYLNLSTDPAGAEVYIGTRRLGVTPWSEKEKIRRGEKVQIEFRKEDYYVERITVNVIGDGSIQTVPTVKLRPQFGWITCLCDDPLADLTVSSAAGVVATGRSGMRVKLNSQMSYKIEASRQSHTSQSQGIKGSTVEGKDIRITVPPPLPIYGALQLKSSPSRARVFIDGQEEGTTAFLKRLLIGTHTVELKLDGYHLDPFEVNIKDGETLKLEKEMIRGPKEVTVTLKTDSGSHFLQDGVYLGPGSTRIVTLEVGREYVLTTELDNSSIRHRPRRMVYTPSGEDDGQTINVPGAEIIFGTLSVKTGKITDADIKVTGRNATRSWKSPYSGTLPVGSYSVTASKIGYRDATEKVDILEGKTYNLNLTLRSSTNMFGWNWGWEESEFSSNFLNYEVGFVPDDFAIGFQYAHCKKHLGFYLRYLYAINYEQTSFSGGAVVRLTSDLKKLDFQLYGGAGMMYEGIGAEAGLRFSWHAGNFSWFDFGGGVQFTPVGVVPVISIGLGIALFPYALLVAPLFSSY